MPYIGTTPTKVVSRQSANVYRYTATAGQTAFTGADLDNNVLACNPADMIVHMNGLRLESTDYTATSTTVTLTTAATAGDEVTVTSFVTFEVADTYTKTAADNRYVNTTGDTMTGALELPTGGLTVGTDQLAVDSAGRVTMPYQPAFRAYQNTDPTTDGDLTAAAGVNWVVQYNRGNNFSGGIFTAPVEGVYAFSVMWDANAALSRIIVRHNGSYHARYEPTGLSNANWETHYYGTHIYLSASDYVYLELQGASGTNPAHMGSGHWGHFSGYLIG